MAHINSCCERFGHLELRRQKEILSDSEIAKGIIWTSISFLATNCAKLK